MNLIDFTILLIVVYWNVYIHDDSAYIVGDLEGNNLVRIRSFTQDVIDFIALFILYVEIADNVIDMVME
ncbi:hypothetical protein QE152_g393 [Popillia japonica]|uniref:Uncharacterized protein n=1 Tax=Popillia japonica TaxID=7064 RepID=A0AAW1NL44_POPJA